VPNPALIPKLLFLAVLFLACLLLAISCCHFSTLLVNEKVFLSNLILYLQNVLQATLPPTVVALATLGTKKLPTDLSVGLETYSNVEALPATHKFSLSDLSATTTSPCVSHHCTPLYATLHFTTHMWLSHCCNLLALRCLWIPCTIAVSATPSASVSTQSASSTTPHRGSHSKVKSKRLGTSRILPLLLGTITPHHPTSYLEVWLHVIPLPTWLEVSPY